MLKTSQPATATLSHVEELKERIKNWEKQSPEVLKEYKEIGVTKNTCKKALKAYLDQIEAQKQAIKPEQSTQNKWSDMKDYIEQIIRDLQTGTKLVPELEELTTFFKSSMKNIEKNSLNNQVLMLLKGQLMTNLYNISLNKFLEKHEGKRNVNIEEIAPNKPSIDGEKAPKNEIQTEIENNRARYTIREFSEEDIDAVDNILFDLGFDPKDFATMAGKAIVARMAFRNNLAYIKVGDPLARSLTKETINKFKDFQNKNFFSWAGSPATGESRQKNINFYMALIKLWEARAFYNEQKLEEAEKSVQQVQKYAPSKNILDEVKGLLNAIKRKSEKVTVQDNQAIFA